MNSRDCTNTGEIAAFVDGQLEPPAEREFEQHLTVCRHCAEKLNEQKRLLHALEFAFDDEKSFKLPADFTKKVIVRAESDVSGLNSKEERRRALFIICGLFLLGILTGIIGRQSGLFPAIVNNFLDQLWVLADVSTKFLFYVGVCVSVFLRVVGRQLDSTYTWCVLVILLGISFIVLPRMWFKYRSGEK